MAELNFGDGLTTFTVNGKCEIEFNPTDSDFVKRLFDTFETLDKKQDTYKEEIEKTADKKEIFVTARKMSDEMREYIDKIFCEPVCDKIFGRMNLYALADGLPVWCNFLLSVMDTVDTTFSREQKATNPRIAKYTAKYKKK